MHECPRCNYESKYKHSLLAHFNRKNTCDYVDKHISIEECKNMLKSGKLKTKKIIIHICKYCSKSFDRKSRLESHIIKCEEKKIQERKKKEKEELEQYKLKELKQYKLKELEQYKLKEKQTPFIELKASTLKELLNKSKKKSNENFIYLLQTREFINSGKQIYKIGKTVNPVNRMGNYGKGCKVKIMYLVEDCDKAEKEIIKLFNEQFILQSDIGREYYKGELKQMVRTMTEYFYNDETVAA